MRAQGTNGAKLRDAIAHTKNVAGVTGAITIDNDRNAVKPAVIVGIKDGKYVHIESVNP